MSSTKVCTILILLIAVECGLAQKKAIQKCREFVLPFAQHIIGGNATVNNEFPHMAALGFGSQRNPEWLCGGTLISNQFVLTAAHCTNIGEMGPVKVVRLGTKSLNPATPHEDVKVAQVIQNPNYSSPSSYNDIALLKLQRKVPFSRSILPACLNTAFNINSATNSFTAIGWGKTDFAGPTSDDLLKVELGVVRRNQCIRDYSRSSSEKLPDGIKDSIQLCAGGEVQKDTCQGDSGGPLEYKSGKFDYVVGVTSFGKACGITRSPGVYTRVSAFVPWIESVVWP